MSVELEGEKMKKNMILKIGTLGLMSLLIPMTFAFAYTYWGDYYAEWYRYGGNDGDGNGYTGSSVIQSLQYDDNDYVYVRDRYSKDDDLWISVDDFSQPPSTHTYGSYPFQTFYRNSVDQITLYLEIKTVVTVGVFDNTENIQMRAVSDDNEVTDWETMEAYPVDESTYKMMLILYYADYEDLFDDIRAGTDFIEEIQVRFEICDEEWLGSVYIYLDNGVITYRDY